MVKAVPKKPLGGAHAVRGAYRYQRAGTVDPRLNQDAADYRYDCILLMDGKLAHGPNSNPTKVGQHIYWIREGDDECQEVGGLEGSHVPATLLG